MQLFRRPSGWSMDIVDLIKLDAIIPALKVTSKKQALQELAKRSAALTGEEERAADLAKDEKHGG